MAEIMYVDWDGLVYYDTRSKQYIKDIVDQTIKFGGQYTFTDVPAPGIETLHVAYKITDKFVVSPETAYFLKTYAGKFFEAGTVILVVEDGESDTYRFDILFEAYSGTPGGELDLSNYYTQAQVDTLLAGKVNIAELDNYYLKTETDKKLADKADRSDLDGLATEEFVNKKIAEAELADKEADLEAYYTKSEVDSLIPDISGFANKTDLEGLASEEFVAASINAIQIPDDYLTEEDLQNKDFATKDDLTAYAKDDDLNTVSLNVEELGKTASKNTADIETLDEAVSDNTGSIDALRGEVTEVSEKVTDLQESINNIAIPEVPTKVSELENDAGYVNQDYVDDKVKVVSAHISATRDTDGVIIHYSDVDSSGTTYLYDGKDGVDGTVIFYSTLDTSDEDFSEETKTFTGSDFEILTSPSYQMPELNDLIITKNSDYWRVTVKGSDYVAARLVARGKGEKGDTPDLSNYYNKTETETIVNEAVNGITIPDTSNFITMEDVEAKGYLTEHQDLSNLATKEEIPDVSNFLTSVPDEYVTDAELTAKGFITEHQDITGKADVNHKHTLAEIEDYVAVDLDPYALKTDLPSIEGLATEEFVTDSIAAIPETDLSEYYTKDETVTAIKTAADSAVARIQKYEVLPIDGMLVDYRENEVRLNTQRVVPTLQTVGSTGDPNMYYATFRAFAPEGATSVIEGLNDKMDTEHSELAVDSYGRKYTTIWSAIANTPDGGNTWNKWGDSSTLTKYLGFYYHFHWYNGDKLIGTDKVRVILTNDACHDDLVPDAVARRIDEKVNSIDIPEYDLSEYAKKTDIPSIEGLATETFVKNAIAEAELNDKDVDLTGYATKDELSVVEEKIPSIEGLATETFVQNAISQIPAADFSNYYNKTETKNLIDTAVGNISIPEVPTNVSAFANDAQYTTLEEVSAQGYLTSIPDEYVTAEELAQEGFLKEHQSLEGYVKDAELTDAIDAVEHKIVTKTSDLENDAGFLTAGSLPAFVAPDDITDLVTLTEVEEAGFLKSIPDEYVTETELADLNYVTEELLTEKGFITDVSNKADKDHSHSYNELTDTPTIPSIEGLATEDYVDDAIANIDVPTVDTTNLLTKDEANTLLETKANDVPFADDYRVGTALGGFVEEESLQGMTVVQILTKLLGLTLYVPPVADLPAGTPEQAEEVIANEYSVYILGESGEQVELTYDYTTMTPAEAKVDNQTDTFFYQIIDPETGVAVESGYQIATIYQENDYLTVYIPETVTKFHVEEYSALAGDWSTPNWILVENPNYNLEGYTAYTVPEEYGITSGITVRIVIEE